MFIVDAKKARVLFTCQCPSYHPKQPEESLSLILDTILILAA